MAWQCIYKGFIKALILEFIYWLKQGQIHPDSYVKFVKVSLHQTFLLYGTYQST